MNDIEIAELKLDPHGRHGQGRARGTRLAMRW